MGRRHIGEQLKTDFKVQGNRIAGSGIEEDDYSESSFPDKRPRHKQIKTYWHKPIKIKTYPVKEYKLSDKELEYYRNLKNEKGDVIDD